MTTTEPQPTTRPFEELRSSGLLHYLNRVAFHPRGFALALHYPDPGDDCPECKGTGTILEPVRLDLPETCPTCEGRKTISRDDVIAGRVSPLGWSLEGDGLECWTFTEEADDEGFERIEATLAESLRRLKRQKATAEPDPRDVGPAIDPNPARAIPLGPEG